MFVAGLIAGMLVLALIIGVVSWGTGNADAGNHWKAETSDPAGDFFFGNSHDLATRVSQIPANCRIEVASIYDGDSVKSLLYSGCP